MKITCRGERGHYKYCHTTHAPNSLETQEWPLRPLRRPSRPWGMPGSATCRTSVLRMRVPPPWLSSVHRRCERRGRLPVLHHVRWSVRRQNLRAGRRMQAMRHVHRRRCPMRMYGRHMRSRRICCRRDEHPLPSRRHRLHGRGPLPTRWLCCGRPHGLCGRIPIDVAPPGHQTSP